MLLPAAVLLVDEEGTPAVVVSLQAVLVLAGGTERAPALLDGFVVGVETEAAAAVVKAAEASLWVIAAATFGFVGMLTKFVHEEKQRERAKQL